MYRREVRVTDTTIGKLKIGTPLIMGKYGVNRDRPKPIIWLKGTPNGDFITRDAIDYLPFDAKERENAENENARIMGNSKYSVSNLLQFLNSAEESWFSPMHQFDTPPTVRNVDWNRGQYDQHYGFLYFFEEYEIAALEQDTRVIDTDNVATLVRLPSIDDILGSDRFKLFAKKGVRPKATEELMDKPGAEFYLGSYVPFWASDLVRIGYATYIGRDGSVKVQWPTVNCGVRPVCTINPATTVVLGDDGIHYIKPQEIKQNVRTDEELYAFLGLAQP